MGEGSRLEGRVAIVTGAADGIGRGIAERFVSEGAAVVCADIDDVAGQRAVAELGSASGRTLFISTDVSLSPAVAALVRATVEQFGGIDILVNNAGIAHGPDAERHFLETDEPMWDRIMAVNLKSVYLCSAAVVPFMRTAGRRGGCIINMSSGGAIRAHRNRVAYDATKGAIESATRALALDLAPFGIRVNALAPGVVAVPRRTPVGAEGSVSASDVIPLGRMGTPSDVAAAAAFLASSEAEYVTGISLPVDGGLLAQLRSPQVDVAAVPPHLEEVP